MRAVCLFSLVLFVTSACASEIAETPQSVVLAFLADMKANGPAAAMPRFTHADECAWLKQTLTPRVAKSRQASSDDFTERVFGKRVPLETFRSMPPCEVLSLLLWQARMSGTQVETPRFLSAEGDGDVRTLVVSTRFTGLDANPIEKTDVIRLKRQGTGWKLLLSPELRSYVQVLILESTPP